MHKLTSDYTALEIEIQYMQIGQVVEVLTGQYVRHIIMRTYQGWVELSNPNRCWDNDAFKGQKGRIFPKGTRITIELGV